MLDLRKRLGIQSWCFRGLSSHAQVIEALQTCSVANLELSHAHLRMEPEADFQGTLDAYQSKNISITTYGVFGIGADEAAARRVFDFAKLAGFATISADIKPGGLPVAEKLCEEYDMRLAIHNHGRRHRYGPQWTLEELFAIATPRIGLCLDTAWMLDAGTNPVDTATKLYDRLYGLHIKDFVFDKAGKPDDTIVGQGNLDLPGLLKLLKERDFPGYVTLEFEGDKDNPVPATKKCVEAVFAAWDAL